MRLSLSGARFTLQTVVTPRCFAREIAGKVRFKRICPCTSRLLLYEGHEVAPEVESLTAIIGHSAILQRALVLKQPSIGM